MKKIGEKIILIIMILLMTFGMCINFEERKAYAEETNTEESNLSEEIETPENESEINGIEEAEVDIPDMEEPEESDEEDEEEEVKEYLMSKDVVVSATPEYIKLKKKGSKGTITTSISPSTIDQNITCKSTNSSVVSVSKSGKTCVVKAKKNKGSAVIIIRSTKYGYRLTAVQVVIGSSSPTVVDNSIMENAKLSGTDLSICYEEPANVTEETFWSCVKMQYTKNELLNEGEAVETNTPTKVTKLSCPKKVTVTKGKTKQIKCEIPSNKNVTYTVKNKKVATVDSKGKVKGIKKGSTKVTVKISNKEKKTVTIKVTNTSSKKKTSSSNKKTVTKNKTTKKVKVTKVSITNCPSKEIKINESKTLNKKIEPSNATNKKVKWTSNKQNVLSVDSKGKIKGLAKGTATVTVKATDGSGKKATCKVKVTGEVKTTSKTVEPTSMTVSENKKTIAVGNSGTIKLNFTPSNATKTVSWKSSNNNIATVDSNGKIIGKKVGTAVVTVTSSINPKLVQKIKVEVTKKVIPTAIRMKEYNNIIKKGETKQLELLVSPSDVTNTKVTWTSNNKKIVTVDSNGKIKGLKKGQATIKATSKVDKSVKARAIVVVKEEGAFLSINERTITEGQTYSIRNKIVSDEKEKATYKSSKEKVATISSEGKVTGIKKGSTTISVTINGKTEKCKIIVQEQKATGIKLNYTDVEIEAGQTINIKATIMPENTVNKKITWTSSNKKVATVTKNGKIKGIKKGNAIITAKTINGRVATVKVKVDKKSDSNINIVGVNTAVKSVEIEKEEIILGKTGKYKLTAKVKPSDADNKKIKWKSNRPQVATVSSEGIVEAVKKGTATITAYSAENKYIYDTVEIKVKNAPIKINGIKVSNISVVEGKNKKITPIFIPENTTNQNVTYMVDNPAVATVDQTGKVTGVAVGVANISVVSEENNEVVAISTVTVTERILPTAITLNKTTATIKEGKTVTLKLDSVEPGNTTDKIVKWSSSDKKVATVDSKGTVTGKKEGTATVTATTVEGNVAASCEVTINNEDVKVSSVSLDKSSSTVYLNSSTKTIPLVATISPSTATNKKLTWTSSNTTVATVDSKGVVTAKNPGTATIKVKTNDGNKTASMNITVKKNIIIVIGASQVTRMKQHVTSYSSSKYDYNTSDKTLMFINQGGSGIEYQYGDGFKVAKEEIEKYKDVKKYVKFFIYFPLSGNTIRKYSCDEISSSNSDILKFAKGYNNAIKTLKNNNYVVQGYVVSMHPVKASQSNGSYVVTNSNPNACDKVYRSNYKYYQFNKAIKRVINDNYSSNLKYESLFSKIMDTKDGSKTNFSYNIAYDTVDGVHWDASTTKIYVQMMLDYNLSDL